MRSLRSYVFRRETPVGRTLFAMLRRASRWDCPVIPGVHHLLRAERSFRRAVLRPLFGKVYYAPLLRMSCESVGTGLLLYENMPKFLGNLEVVLGNRVTLSGDHVWISGGSGKANRFVVGDDTYLGHALQVISGSTVTIGKHVSIGNRVVLNGFSGHPLDPMRRAAGEPPDLAGSAPITIEDYVWIANDATVLPGVTIGRGAVVASGAIVTKDVPELAVVAGVPARVVRTIPRPTGWP
jgi:acetyltransferase-like isoleucine patch superfamily enzyme